jgi:hypothetical protein
MRDCVTQVVEELDDICVDTPNAARLCVASSSTAFVLVARVNRLSVTVSCADGCALLVLVLTPSSCASRSLTN